MRTFRRLIFWTHLIIGVAAGIVVFLMSATGVLLTYEKQIVAWADTRGYDAGPPAPGATRLPIETLVAKVRAERPDLNIGTITVKADANAPSASPPVVRTQCSSTPTPARCSAADRRVYAVSSAA